MTFLEFKKGFNAILIDEMPKYKLEIFPIDRAE
jgi:hypothetical protein